MIQTAALNALINRIPFNQLIGGFYSTIWIKKTADGYTVSGRTKTDDVVVSLPSDGAQALVIDLDSVLGDAKIVDVQISGATYGITRAGIVGGNEYSMTEHARIPPSARGVPTVFV